MVFKVWVDKPAGDAVYVGKMEQYFTKAEFRKIPYVEEN